MHAHEWQMFLQINEIEKSVDESGEDREEIVRRAINS